MAMTLPPGEPAAGPWREAMVDELVTVVLQAAGSVVGRPHVVAFDGRGAGGKSTLAEQIRAHVPGSCMVRTDDVAWHHSFFDWTDLLVRGVLEPVHRGHPVSYRPPAWEARDRRGAIEVPADTELVLVEGVGAGRRELRHLLDAVVWVQSDYVEAERRGIARDVAEGTNGDLARATAFWHEWMAQELPFLDRQRPWERACVTAAGTRPHPTPPGVVLIAPAPHT